MHENLYLWNVCRQTRPVTPSDGQVYPISTLHGGVTGDADMAAVIDFDNGDYAIILFNPRSTKQTLYHI